jgi:hypothetical protein
MKKSKMEQLIQSFPERLEIPTKINIFDISKSILKDDVETLHKALDCLGTSTIGYESSPNKTNSLHCPYCRKTFSSQQTYKNHESSSKHKSAMKNSKGSPILKKNLAVEPQWLLDVIDDLSLLETLDLSDNEELMEAIDIYWDSCQVVWNEGYLKKSFECLLSLSNLIESNEVSWQNQLEAQVALARFLSLKEPQESLALFKKILENLETQETDNEQELTKGLEKLNLVNTDKGENLIQVLSKDIFVSLHLYKAMTDDQFQFFTSRWLKSCKESPSDIVFVVQTLHLEMSSASKQTSRRLRDIALETSESSMMTQTSHKKEKLQLLALAMRIDLELGNLETF